MSRSSNPFYRTVHGAIVNRLAVKIFSSQPDRLDINNNNTYLVTTSQWKGRLLQAGRLCRAEEVQVLRLGT